LKPVGLFIGKIAKKIAVLFVDLYNKIFKKDDQSGISSDNFIIFNMFNNEEHYFHRSSFWFLSAENL